MKKFWLALSLTASGVFVYSGSAQAVLTGKCSGKSCMQLPLEEARDSGADGRDLHLAKEPVKEQGGELKVEVPAEEDGR